MTDPIKKTPQEIAKSLLDPKVYEEEQKQKAELAKKAATKKVVIEKQAQPKTKQYYDVRVECMLPATLTYRILAEDASQALELIKGKSPNSVQHKLIGRRELVAKVFNAGGNLLQHMKKLLG
jgi:hypothetical protein